MSRLRTYSELQAYTTLKDRYDYLALRGQVAEATFGFDRYMNQMFYASREWKRVRNIVIDRDRGNDLGHPDHPINERVYIHHMNPMTVDDLKHGNDDILDPEYLISVTHRTHNAIHYGDERLLPRPLIVRRPGDTKLW